MKNLLVFSVIAIFQVGCFNLSSYAHMENVAIEATLKQASFDMDCDDLSAELIGDFKFLNQRAELANIGVKGCGKRATYEALCSGNYKSNTSCKPRLNNISQPIEQPNEQSIEQSDE